VTDDGLPVVVVPCFNEGRRLDPARLESLAASGRLRLLFVDDGSTDGTRVVLREVADSSTAIEVLTVPTNLGKAEAVRRGIVHVVGSGARVTGYYDADLATPPSELLRLLGVLESRPDLLFVMGSRVKLLGRTIERSTARHYLGRIFATLASLVLQLPVYDTQCGAKVFRVTPALAEAVDWPFHSQWSFDVELIARLLRGSRTAEPYSRSAFEEVPLQEWRDIQGSKIGLRGMARSIFDLVLVGVELRTGRRGGVDRS
jgi:glycosyltransferase involved in cell wall biosynthesis